MGAGRNHLLGGGGCVKEGHRRCICCSLSSLTICDLQLGLGQDAARHRQRLADVVAGVGPLHRRDGEVAAGRHREAAVGLLGLVGKEEVLRGRERERSRQPVQPSRGSSLQHLHRKSQSARRLRASLGPRCLSRARDSAALAPPPLSVPLP